MNTASTFLAISLASIASCMNLLLPLYIYPTTEIVSQVTHAAASHPGVTFYTMVNPNSGPGEVDGSGFPKDPVTIAALKSLNQHKNIVPIGYVHVLDGNRPAGEVKTEVATYAKWSKYKQGNIGLRGIFFDEAPKDGDKVAYMHDLTRFSNNHFKGPSTFNAFNPGTAVRDLRYYDFADMILAHEDYFSSGKMDMDLGKVPAGKRGKTAITLNAVPVGTDLAAITQKVKGKASAVYYAETHDYKTLSLLEKTADAAAEAGGAPRKQEKGSVR